MKIRQITGDEEINDLLDAAMSATLIALTKDGLITAQQETDFIKNHIITMTSGENGFSRWYKRFFGKEDKESRVVVFSQKNQK